MMPTPGENRIVRKGLHTNEPAIFRAMEGRFEVLELEDGSPLRLEYPATRPAAKRVDRTKKLKVFKPWNERSLFLVEHTMRSWIALVFDNEPEYADLRGRFTSKLRGRVTFPATNPHYVKAKTWLVNNPAFVAMAVIEARAQQDDDKLVPIQAVVQDFRRPVSTFDEIRAIKEAAVAEKKAQYEQEKAAHEAKQKGGNGSN